MVILLRSPLGRLRPGSVRFAKAHRQVRRIWYNRELGRILVHIVLRGGGGSGLLRLLLLLLLRHRRRTRPAVVPSPVGENSRGRHDHGLIVRARGHLQDRMSPSSLILICLWVKSLHDVLCSFFCCQPDGWFCRGALAEWYQVSEKMKYQGNNEPMRTKIAVTCLENRERWDNRGNCKE